MLDLARRIRSCVRLLPFALALAAAGLTGTGTAASTLLAAGGVPAAVPVDQRNPVGDIGVYFDAAYSQRTASVPAAFTPFTFYVVAKGLAAPGVQDGIEAYEFGLGVPVGLIVSGGRVLPPGYTDFGSGDDNWIVGTGGCRTFLANGGDTYLLVTYAACLFLATPGQNLVVDVTRATPTSFDPPTPGFLSCEPGAIFPFAATNDGRINPIPCNLDHVTIAGSVLTGRDISDAQLFTYDAGKPITSASVGDVNGDGESDVLLYTASDGVAPGSVVLLNCQGGVIWSFTSSGGCVVTNGIVDVTSVELGDFDTGAAGPEILVIARANPANGAEVTRVTLLNPDGTVHKANVGLPQEYWVAGDMPVHTVVDVAGARSLILAGDNTTFGAQPVGFALRVRLDNMRGQAPVRPAGAPCALGTQLATATWEFEPNVGPAAADPYFQRESRITGLTIDGEVGTFTGQSGGVYELTLSDLLPIPCTLAQVTVAGAGDTLVGEDLGGNPLWSFAAGSPITFASIVALPAAKFILLATDASGSRPSSVLTLECHGKTLASFDGTGSTCYGDTELPQVQAFLPERVAPGGPFTGVYHALYRYATSGNTRIDRTDFGPDGRDLTADSHYDFPGEITLVESILAFDPGRPAFLMGARNDAAGGVAHVLAFDAAAIAGAAPPLQTGCTAGSQLWSSLFDGSAGFPLEPGAVTAIERVDGFGFTGTLRVTVQSGHSYLLDAATGALIPSCSLAAVEATGTTVRGLDGDGGELWTYDAGTTVLAAFLRDLDADGQPEAVGLAQTSGETAAHAFAVDCAGAQVYAVDVAALDCFGASPALPQVNTGLSDFAAGVLVLDDGVGEVAQIVGFDLTAGAVLGTYAHRGSLAAVQMIAQTPAPDLVAAVGRNVALDAGVAFAIPFGYTGASAPGCALQAAKRFDTPWTVVFDGSSPDTPLEPAMTSLAVEGDALRVTAQDGSSYLLLASDGTPVPCELLAAELDGTAVVGTGSGGSPLWSYETGSTVLSATLVDLGGTTAPEVVVTTALDGTAPGQILALTCGGQLYWAFDSTAADCWGEQESPAAQAIERLYLGIDLAGDGGSALLAITGLASGTAYRVVHIAVTGDVAAEYWHLGGFADATLVDLDSDQVMDLVVLGASGGAVGSAPADLLRLDCTALDGAAPPDPGSCADGSQMWWLVWDDSMEGLPSETQPGTVTPVGGDLLQVQMGSGATYTITADGQPLTDVLLSLSTAGPAAPGDEVVVTLDGSNLSRVAGFDGTLSYDPALLTFVDAEPGALLTQLGGASTAFNGSVPGSFEFAAARATQFGSASGELVRLRLRVADDAPTGLVAVTFAAISVYDEEAVALGVQTQDGGVDVSCVKLDVSGDGTLHSNDAVLALRISAQLLVPDARQACAADADGDGTINAGDAVLILRAIVGLPIAGAAGADVSHGPLGPAQPAAPARVALDGAAWREATGTVVVPLIVEGAAEVAGLDLTLRIAGSTGTFAAATLTGGDGTGLLVVRANGQVLTVAAAASERLTADGRARLQVRLQDVAADATSLQLAAVGGAAFDVRAARSPLASTTLTVPLGDVQGTPARRTQLFQNQPNPFNPRTEIRFALAHDAVARLTVLDVAGRLVATLVDGPQGAGDHLVVWNGADDLGMPVASGVYLYQLQADGERQVRRMALVR